METIDDVKRAVDDMRPAQLVDVFVHLTGRCFACGVWDGEGLDRTMRQLEKLVEIRKKPIARRPKRRR